MTLCYVETLTVPIDIPEDNPGNAKLHDDDWLDRTVSPGQHRSLMVRRLDDGRLQILGGHGTRAALARKGVETIRVEVFEGSDADAREALLSDNPPKWVGYDGQKLLDLLTAADADAGLYATGWESEDLLALLDDPTALDVRNENPFDYRPDGEGSAGDGPPAEGGAAYTAAVNIPQYEVVGPCPDVTELRDETRAEALRARIWEANIPDDLRDYLLAAAGRHAVFNYRKAAEYYPHATAEVQALMEESALVIIDVDDAIRLGYAHLTETIAALEEGDRVDA